ncbi:MAG: DNA-3-methyladenine glycosylase [Candidatus Bathyarchaeota archaeon]|nr:DNA-3-methyladenine glycosylase [Candidatus Bathyarchaeota archaeon]
MAFAEAFTFEVRAPFSLALSALVFSSGDSHVRGYANGAFSQVLSLSEGLVWAKVTSSGTEKQPRLHVELKSNKPITAQTKREAQQALTYIFSLDFDLADFYRETETDPVMKRVAAALCGFKFPVTPTAFEGLVDAIVEQQISIKVARTIEERLALKLGEHIEIEGETYSAFPTPQQVASASISDIQGCGLSLRKAQYIHGAAKMIAEGKLDLEGMKQNPNAEEIVVELDALKGIGVWTAELTVLRGMQRYDVLPADDFGIRRVISTYYCSGKPIQAAEAREVAKAWGRWKGLAAFYLMAAEVKGVDA